MSLILEIVTPEGKAYSDAVEHVVLPTEDGQIDVLPGHIPLLSIVQPGEVRVRRAGIEESLAVDKGFVRVLGNTVAILTEAAINVEEINLSEVEAAATRAQTALAEARSRKEIDPSELDRIESIARFSIAQKLAKQKKL